MSAAEIAFNLLNREERLSLLLELGFNEPQKYLGWEEIDLSYSCLFYEVQDELDRCYHKGKWVAPETESKPLSKAKNKKRTPRR